MRSSWALGRETCAGQFPPVEIAGKTAADRREGSFMNTSLRLLLGMAILSVPAVGLQVLRPGWLQDARRELGVLGESRERVTTEGERKERLAEATTSATARLAAKQRLVMDLVAEVTT